ncbi:MAG TPA: rhodanese-like domain-containing protein [Candidatus Sulfobium mesophilum]|jgi:rhodanese-related sulfurtransferase|nr:rhodanese-like domain-containing protein [Candidatus Sulfobium mesophilum]
MAKKIALLIIALCFTACATQRYGSVPRTSDQMVKEAKATISEVTIDDVKKMIYSKDKIIILDVRDKDEFETGYIPGAINLSRGMLEFKINTVIPDRNARIIVYCGVDLRGPLATKTLNEMGYINAVNINGGLKVWKAAGYPIAK